MSTYTYVSYFVDDDIDPLKDEIKKLFASVEGRKDFMHPKAYEAATNRLNAMVFMTNLLLEPVPRPYGG